MPAPAVQGSEWHSAFGARLSGWWPCAEGRKPNAIPILAPLAYNLTS